MYRQNYGYGSNNNYRGRDSRQKAGVREVRITFAEDKYVDEAEEVIEALKEIRFKDGGDELTTSAIRNILSMTSAIYDLVKTSDLDIVTQRLLYLRVQLVYASGRNKMVNWLVKRADLLNILSKINLEKDPKEKKKLIIRFCRYMEALVAYFKFNGGK